MSINTLWNMYNYIQDIEQIVGKLNQKETRLYLQDEEYSDGMITAYMTTFFTANPRGKHAHTL